ncbi:MAG: hypothetical protein ABI409_16705 [Ramlibacter sp.]
MNMIFCVGMGSILPARPGHARHLQLQAAGSVAPGHGVPTNLAVSTLMPEIQSALGKSLVGVNVANYWLALCCIGTMVKLPRLAMLGEQH